MASGLIILTIGLPWLGALAVMLAGDKRPRTQNTLAVAFAVAAGIAALVLLPFNSRDIALQLPVGGIFGNFTFVPDGLGVFLAAIATVVGSLAVVFSIDYMRGEAQLGRYLAFVLFFIGGMAGLVLTSSLLLLFFFWEIVAFCSYGLISFHNDDPMAVAGGIKALLITQIGGIGLLAGALTAYVYVGSYDLNAFIARASAGALPPDVLAVIAFGFLIAAAAKSAQVPFQTWLPDAMEAPTPVSALIHAATMVNAGVYVLARFYPAFASVPGWTSAVIAVGLLSVLLAAVMALVANDLKRVLAYSTISQLGYMVTAVGLGAIYASQFHLLSHAVFKALLFLGAGAVIHAVGTRDMRQMGGLGKQMPFVRTVFVIGALALAGIPILNGFWSKELILESASVNPLVFAGLVLGAGLTALYTFRMVWLVFAGEPHGIKHAHDAPTAMRVSLALLAFGTLTTWLLAGPFEYLLDPGMAFSTTFGLTLEKCVEVVTAPVTYLALVIIALGLATWWWRERLRGLATALRLTGRPLGQAPARWATQGFGFEWLNQRVVTVTQGTANALRVTQTGQLNWNVVGIVAGLLIVLLILGWRG